MALTLFADFIDKFEMSTPVLLGLAGVAVILIIVFIVMRMKRPADD